ncbi:hypothetical protein TRFO_07069 [Tritrichomonas foetus]|uniref:Uncharacterized protein n=1 Tax=Tritrichomonas foetus TaxID=1144522 RepID=A0A1J4JZF4_9EUKA|nr:hypothetical protein TRFO_07069 [Tritrichomonas foetus]|eukprot:OHT02637.1 hypothetical protein TRFO_07069 [Tritrichomonas foetus]
MKKIFLITKKSRNFMIENAYVESDEEIESIPAPIDENPEEEESFAPQDQFCSIHDIIKKAQKEIGIKYTSSNDKVTPIVTLEKFTRLLSKLVKAPQFNYHHRKIIFSAVAPIHHFYIMLINSHISETFSPVTLKKCVDFFIKVHHYLQLDNPQINDREFFEQVRNVCRQADFNEIEEHIKNIENVFLQLRKHQSYGEFSLKRLQNCTVELKKFRIVLGVLLDDETKVEFFNIYETFLEDFRVFKLFYKINTIILQLKENWSFPIEWSLPCHISKNDDITLFEEIINFLVTFWGIYYENIDDENGDDISDEDRNGDDENDDRSGENQKTKEEEDLMNIPKYGIFQILDQLNLSFKFHPEKSKTHFLDYINIIKKFNTNFQKNDDEKDLSCLTTIVYGLPFTHNNAKSNFNSFLEASKEIVGNNYKDSFSIFYEFLNFVNISDDCIQIFKQEINKLINSYSDQLLRACLHEESLIIGKITNIQSDHLSTQNIPTSLKVLIQCTREILETSFISPQKRDFLERFYTFIRLHYAHFYLQESFKQNKSNNDNFNNNSNSKLNSNNFNNHLNNNNNRNMNMDHFMNDENENSFEELNNYFPRFDPFDLFEFQNSPIEDENGLCLAVESSEFISKYFNTLRGKSQKQAFICLSQRRKIFEFQYYYEAFCDTFLTKRPNSNLTLCYEPTEYVNDLHYFFKIIDKHIMNENLEINNIFQINHLVNAARKYSLCWIFQEYSTPDNNPIIRDEYWLQIKASLRVPFIQCERPIQKILMFLKSTSLKEKYAELEFKPYTNFVDSFKSFLTNFDCKIIEQIHRNLKKCEEQSKDIDDFFNVKEIINEFMSIKDYYSELSEAMVMINSKYQNNDETSSRYFVETIVFANILKSFRDSLIDLMKFDLLTTLEKSIKEQFYSIFDSCWPISQNLLDFDPYLEDPSKLALLLESLYNPFNNLRTIYIDHHSISYCYDGFMNLVINVFELNENLVKSVNPEIRTNYDQLVNIFHNTQIPSENQFYEIFIRSSIIVKLLKNEEGNSFILSNVMSGFCNAIFAIIIALNIKDEIEMIIKAIVNFGNIFNINMNFIQSNDNDTEDDQVQLLSEQKSIEKNIRYSENNIRYGENKAIDKYDKRGSQNDNLELTDKPNHEFPQLQSLFEEATPIFEKLRDSFPQDSPDLLIYKNVYNSFNNIKQSVKDLQIPENADQLNQILHESTNRLEELSKRGRAQLAEMVKKGKSSDKKCSDVQRLLESDYGCITQQIDEETLKGEQYDEDISNLLQELDGNASSHNNSRCHTQGTAKIIKNRKSDIKADSKSDSLKSDNKSDSKNDKNDGKVEKNDIDGNDDESENAEIEADDDEDIEENDESVNEAIETQSESSQEDDVDVIDFNLNVTDDESNDKPIAKAQIVMMQAHEIQKQNNYMKLQLKKMELANKIAPGSSLNDGLDDVLQHIHENVNKCFTVPERKSRFDDDDDENPSNLLSHASLYGIISEIRSRTQAPTISLASHNDLCDRIERIAMTLLNETHNEEKEMEALQNQLNNVRTAQKDKLMKLRNVLRNITIDDE